MLSVGDSFSFSMPIVSMSAYTSVPSINLLAISSSSSFVISLSKTKIIGTQSLVNLSICDLEIFDPPVATASKYPLSYNCWTPFSASVTKTLCAFLIKLIVLYSPYKIYDLAHFSMYINFCSSSGTCL